MKKTISGLLAVLIAVISSGCIVSGTPKEDPVFVFPGTTKTFTIKAFPENGELVWLLDGEEVQSGGTTFEYTAPADGATSHTLVVQLLHPFGEDTYGWNITSNAEEASASPNNPHVPPGPGPWFEGWYTRVSDVGGSRSIAVIGASSLPKDTFYIPGEYLPGYINVLISEGDGAPTLSFTVFPELTMALVDGEPVSENPVPFSPANFVWIAESFGTITQNSVDITIPGVLDVHIQTQNRLPFNIYSPETGPYGALDLLPLPLRWWVQSLGSDAEYEYTLLGDPGSETINGVGYAHLEKNWGAGFPMGWVWTQGIAEDNEAQFVMSTAEVDFELFILNAWIAAYRSPIVSWDFIFTMPETVIYTERNACEGTFLFEITQPDRRLTFDAFAPIDTFGDVSTPSEDGFAPETGVESFSATVEVSAYEAESLVDQRVFHNAALEYGAGYVCE